MIGRTLAHYQIEAKLGEGGMGVVFRARDTHLDRPVAIKVLPRDKIADPLRKQRFVQEAKAASALNHPNIITIHDINADADVDFMVMEFIDGQTLDTQIPRGGMRPEVALKIAVQLAGALASAHSAAIVHRDLKPSNVMVTSDGRAKILDFGVAKLLERADSSGDAARTTRQALTLEGVVVGTAAYMSPEQVDGGRVDARSDIFSFGSVLYEMVTGRPAFAGNSPVSIAARVLNDEPAPPRSTNPVITPELEQIVLRCLRKDPARRYQTMAEVKSALEDAQQSRPGRAAGRLPIRRLALWAPPLLMLALVAGVFFKWRSSEMADPQEPLRAVALTSFPGIELSPTLSPDSNQVAFAWNGPRQDNFDIYVQVIGAGTPLRITTDPRSDQNPVWSPDGRWIAFLRGDTPGGRSLSGKTDVRLIPALGGAERKIAEIRINPQPNAPAYIAWCPDSSCLVITDADDDQKPFGIYVLSIDSGEKRPVLMPPPGIVGDANPVISPDGRSLVFQRFTSGRGADLHVLALGPGFTASGEPRRLTSPPLNAVHPAWTADGRDIVFSAEQRLWRIAASGNAAPTPLPFVGEDGLWPVVSRPRSGHAGRLAYVRSFTDMNIWRIETPRAGGVAVASAAPAIASTRTDEYAELSPDARQVAFISDRSGGPQVWLADPDGSNAVVLTSMVAAGVGTPRWSHDGQLIAFNSNPEGQQDIYVVPAAGGRPRRLTSDPANEIIPSFSADDQWIYFSRRDDAASHIWKVPVAGGASVQVTQNVGWVALESPDGAALYYTETSGPEPSPLWRLSSSGGAPRKIVDGVYMRAFVVLDGGIYFIDQSAGETRLQFFDFVTERSSVVARNLGNVRTGLTSSREGRTLLYTVQDSAIDDLMLVENFR